MPLNWTGVFVAAFVPLVVGLAWYHPRVFGRAWNDAAGLAPGRPEWAGRPWVLGASVLLGFLVASLLMPSVIHQIHVFSIMQGDPEYGKEGAKVTLWLESFMASYGSRYRTFRHGAVHGAIVGLFFSTPMIAANAVFERRGWRYVVINAGYWTISLAVMGGILCGWR